MPGTGESPSLYSQCRQWVHNDPNIGTHNYKPEVRSYGNESKVVTVLRIASLCVCVRTEQSPNFVLSTACHQAAASTGSGERGFGAHGQHNRRNNRPCRTFELRSPLGTLEGRTQADAGSSCASPEASHATPRELSVGEDQFTAVKQMSQQLQCNALERTAWTTIQQDHLQKLECPLGRGAQSRPTEVPPTAGASVLYRCAASSVSSFPAVTLCAPRTPACTPPSERHHGSPQARAALCDRQQCPPGLHSPGSPGRQDSQPHPATLKPRTLQHVRRSSHPWQPQHKE